MDGSIWSATLAEFREKVAGKSPVPAGVAVALVGMLRGIGAQFLVDPDGVDLAAARSEGRRALVELQGPVGVGKKFVAEGLCAELGQELFVADCRAMLLTGHGGVYRELLPARLAEVRREALLVGAAPYLDHYDSILTKHDPTSRGPNDNESREVQSSPTFKMPIYIASSRR